jgi:uncharacterized protein YeaO (DUF488 family)
MNDAEMARCREFARVLFGAGLDPEFMNATLGFCESLDDFRVRLVAELAPHNEVARGVMDRWASAIRPSREQLDGNALLHMLEAVAARVAMLEEKLRAASEENLERLRAIDSNATTLTSFQESAAAMRESLATIRERLEVLDEVSGTSDGVGK